MKKLTLTCLWCIVTTCNMAFGQNYQNANSTSFLRNYKAPDFKVHALSFNFKANGASNSFNGEATSNQSGNLNYSLLSNSQRYQGLITAGLNTNFNLTRVGAANNIALGFSLTNAMQNRFYFKNEWFVGVHNNMTVNASSIYFDSDQISRAAGFITQPIFSVGLGRMEPVQFARNAMDIERALQNGDRLSREYTEAELKTIADRVTRTNNIRFYDFRLRRIEQFKELDAALQGIGNVTDADITYFANLSDAYLYAKNFARFSGFRQEFGLANRLIVNSFFSDVDISNQVMGSYAFYQLTYDLPKSYAWQHTFQGNLMGGFTNAISSGVVTNDYPLWLTTGYNLGYYPNTRTHLSGGVDVAASLRNGNFGVGAGLNFLADIYITPQLRFSASTSIGYGENYARHGFDYVLNDARINNGFSVNGSLQLRYAIF